MQPNETQAIDRVGAHKLEPRRAGHRDLYGDRDVALHLLGRLTRVLGDNLDDRRRGIGVGLDIERGEGGVADGKERREPHQHQRPSGKTERYQSTQHRLTRRRARSLAAPFVVDEDRPAPDHDLARLQAAKDLQLAALLQSGLHTATLEHLGLAPDPDNG